MNKLYVGMKNDSGARIASIAIGFVFLFTSCSGLRPSINQGKTAIGNEAMVVTAHPEATRVGVDILGDGGNAVDAMVAVHFALAVVYPSAGNIGGGGFLVLRDTTGETYSLDFREKAPLAAHEDMYLDENGEVIDGLSLHGHLAAGVRLSPSLR